LLRRRFIVPRQGPQGGGGAGRGPILTFRVFPVPPGGKNRGNPWVDEANH